MDLRKSILKKQVALSDTINVNNTSNISYYDSATEDNDTTLFYSFTDDVSGIVLSENDATFEADKENTIIQQRHSIPVQKTKIIVSDYDENHINEAETLNTPRTESSGVIAKSPTIQMIVNNESTSNEDATKNEVENIVIGGVRLEPAESIEEIEPPPDMANVSFTENQVLSRDVEMETVGTVANLSLKLSEDTETGEIIMESKALSDTTSNSETIARPLPNFLDPRVYNNAPTQEDLVTVDSPSLLDDEQDPNRDIPNPFLSQKAAINKKNSPRSTRRSLVPTKIPSKTLLYSPVIRRSTSKLKPEVSRRSIVELSNQPGPSGISVVTKTPTATPKPAAIKTKAHPDSQKILRRTSTAINKPLFICKWCDKKFQLDNALTSHQVENCTKIPAIMKKKVMSVGDKRESRRRTSFFSSFAPPMTKRKSPNRRPMLNKSGIKITPKKSIKCHLCTEIFTDAISLAEHILAHKYNRENGIAQKSLLESQVFS